MGSLFGGLLEFYLLSSPLDGEWSLSLLARHIRLECSAKNLSEFSDHHMKTVYNCTGCVSFNKNSFFWGGLFGLYLIEIP